MTPEKASLLGAPVCENGVAPVRQHPYHSKRRFLHGAVLTLAGLSLWRACCSTSMTKRPTPEPASSNICTTPACIHASSEILYNLSPNYKDLDPCDGGFEELVCGGWRERHELRPDQGDAFTGTIMAENSQLLLRHILEAPYPKSSKHSFFSPMQLGAASHSDDEDNFDKMASAYKACLDEETIKKIGVAPLKDIISKIKSTSAQSENALSDTILLLSRYGVSGFVSSGTGADDTNPDVVVVFVSPPGRIGLPSKERYEDDALVKKYQGVVVEVLSQLAPDEKKETLAAVVDLEKRLAAAAPSTEERQDITKSYNPMSLGEASELVPKVDLAHIISTLASSQDVDRVIVTAPKYLKELQTILKETDPAVVQNYFIWKVVQAYHSYVDSPVTKPYKSFVAELSGKDPNSVPERWRTCVAHVDDTLGWILSRFFIEKSFSAAAKEFGDVIVSDIKVEFIKKLNSADWMKVDERAEAIDKVHAIDQKIGYPTKSPNILDPGSLAKYYHEVNITYDRHFENALSATASALADEWSKLGKPVDRNEWGMTASTVNAYYNPAGNEIVFPAGIMQFPVFDVDTPAYVSYGAFGSVAGHELSHAFDSTGRHYDKRGTYQEWWSNATVKAFKERAQCFVDQYSNYTVPGPDNKPLHVNGRLTLGENIADAGGLSAAFQAWRRRASVAPNQDLPGLEHFTQDQLFFVSYSNWWCGKSRKDAAIERIFSDPHAPKVWRIIGSMSNSREFREAFNCPVKEPTCELW
ncbi:hypothetical protein QBC39DRAFT_278180 [Podospora conica]|nr:hypothetical protein QBC39DRAFT_278180 [Schizothecium conicum]